MQMRLISMAGEILPLAGLFIGNALADILLGRWRLLVWPQALSVITAWLSADGQILLSFRLRFQLSLPGLLC